MKSPILLLIVFLFFNGSSFAQNSRQRDIDAFASQTGAITTTDRATNSLNHLRFPIGQALNLEGSSPEQKALFFITKYANLFERNPAKDSYQVKEVKRDNYGLDHVVLQQFHDRVPVYDGVLKFHFNKEGRLTSLNGNFIIAENLNATPSISSEEVGQTAIKLVTGQKTGKFAAPLKINKNALFVFQKGLAQGYKGPLHLVYEVEVRNDADVREFLYIDAHSKELVEQFTGMHSIDRKLYETSVSDPNLKWQESDGTGGAKYNALDQWQKSEVDAAGHIYNLMKNAFGQNSYDNAGAAMVTVHNNINCANASWNGSTANFCQDVAADDVVAHEWAHAYTEYTSGLIYAWQAGALNESYSDIWGETVDLLNAYFDNGENNGIRNACGSSTRWRTGEQATAFGGAIRDMWDPTCNGDPGKISDQQYWCDNGDAGGVHSNSGILNHAFALLVDGGNYNGKTIQGLGLTKAAHIFWHAQEVHMTSTTDFAAQADILEASLTDLIGIDLPKLSTEAVNSGFSGIKITAADLSELSEVIAAIEMRIENNCSFQPLFKPVDVLCDGASPQNAFFYENFENGIANWTLSTSSAYGNWTPPLWKINNTPPAGRSGKVIFARNTDGNCENNIKSGSTNISSPQITVPVDAIGPFTLAFDHFVSLESGRDGGSISYKINAGAWQNIPESAFIANGYNTVLFDFFSGGNEGAVTSDWGQSRINLSALGLTAGQSIQFRWELHSDGCDGWEGWFVDDVRVYSCTRPTVQFTEAGSWVNEGEANISNSDPYGCLPFIEKSVTIKINKAPSHPVTVTLNSPTGTANNGVNSDYSITPESFVLQAGQLAKDVIIRIYNDAYVEDSESITLSYSLSSPDGGNATPETFNQQHVLTITDDDIMPGTVQSNLISADFNNHSIPAGWKISGCCKYPETWGVVDWGTQYSLDTSGPPLLAISSELGNGPMDQTVETSAFNATELTSINLSFSQYLGIYQYDFPEQAMIDVWDGASWHNLLTQDQAGGTLGYWKSPSNINISIPIAYANPAMKIRFRYIANWDYWWLIDNVQVSGTYKPAIQSAVSTTPDSQYLGPNATVYFRDPQSSDLIAKIKNLTAHDYGCTSVEVDRAGTDKTAWVGGYSITTKTFKVTPTNDDLNGNYEITLYYKASELPTFNGNKIKSMGKSEGSIAQATLANSISAPASLAILNSDFAYTATFTGGFSGFGLSDAPAGGALPVTLSKFEGKNTAEGNVLLWETAAEVNNEHFVIERSTNGKDFTAISKMAGVGTSAITNKYSFTDRTLERALHYYRLKQVDKDGTFAYSKIIAIQSPANSGLKFFPNPVQSTLFFEISDLDIETCNLTVTNSAGKIVLRDEKLVLENGKIALNVSQLAPGIYIVTASTPSGNYNFSIIKAP
ncbi:M4 family metallopeptidase [Dyadobacter aurulentus]|uniref:M4 family metallopeptidase n=1 Tax=Dyadobacter sp. UC 10 TaxID=2605428 RepID=UPI0011F0BA6A|nr:M4 family metallopeptidase [Dyadobacter sp. UC 10]KAA0991210.1 T9SS type A sorting domain-containing protein [Dyadobacter sp. UC 10]